jgi:hypothetical protein
MHISRAISKKASVDNYTFVNDVINVVYNIIVYVLLSLYHPVNCTPTSGAVPKPPRETATFRLTQSHLEVRRHLQTTSEAASA